MRLTLTAALSVLFATPAFAAKGPFFSLGNSDFVVLLGLIVFIGGRALAMLTLPFMFSGLLAGLAVLWLL